MIPERSVAGIAGHRNACGAVFAPPRALWLRYHREVFADRPAPMSLTPEEVSRVALLARIEVSPQEVESVRDDLNRIFRLIAAMQAVDTADVAPMAHALDVVQPLREDQISESDNRGAFQAVAPEVEAGLYLVPKVIE